MSMIKMFLLGKLIFQRISKSFISYAVGYMLGRYSLDKDGIAFAGGQYDSSEYQVLLQIRTAFFQSVMMSILTMILHACS